MKCGTPVITSNTSSIPEVTGDAAVLINPHDMYDLAGAMEKVLNNPELGEGMRAAGLKQAANFTWRKCAEETLAAYQKLYAWEKTRG